MRKILITLVLLFCTIASYAISSNNDKYWYQNYMKFDFNKNGDLIKESAKYFYPTGNGTFEIMFDYSENSSSVFPVTIWLNTLEAGSGKTIKKEQIGAAHKDVRSTVKVSNKSISFFSLKYQVTVEEDGTIMIYNLLDGKYVSVLLFKPNETISKIYKIRYQVLKDKMANIGWY